jgi:hypothetical protein
MSQPDGHNTPEQQQAVTERLIIELGHALDGFFEDLQAGCDHYPLDRRKATVKQLTAVTRLLSNISSLQKDDWTERVEHLAYPLLQLANILEALPDRYATQLFQRYGGRRFDRAIVAAAVELLMRKGWQRRQAAGYVATRTGMKWKTVLGWRDTLQRTKPDTFAELQCREDLHPRLDIAAYHEVLSAGADDDEDQTVARADNLLGNFFVTTKPRKNRC